MMQMNRRSLLKGSVAIGAAGLVGSAQAKVPAKWDETVDVVVIGSGFAGLAAAIEAKKAGASVVVLEKMPTPGGNSIINGGILTATGCPQQKMHNIKDSVELLEQDMLKAGNYMNDPKKVHVVASQALPTYEWCVNELGVEFLPDAIGQEGGHSVPRYVTTTNGSGSGIVNKELEMVKKLGVPVRLRTYVEEIVRDKENSGDVLGVVVREGYRFPKEGSGKKKAIRAKKGVILCYGGFSADVKYRTFQDPKLNEKLDTTNQPGATSELWRETSAIGCLQVQNDWIQCGPWGNPKEKGMGIGWQFNQTAAAEYGLWLNTAGKRFVNELANRKVRADAIMVEQLNGKRCYALCNEANVAPLNKQRPGKLQQMLDMKILAKFNTFDEAVKSVGMDLEEAKKSLAQMNEAVAKYKDKNEPVWGTFINHDRAPLTEGPWYIGELQPKVHHSMGGLVTDENGMVLDVRTYAPIPHLWAAGESTGMVHGAVRLGSCAILDCLVCGRIAGKNAAKA